MTTDRATRRAGLPSGAPPTGGTKQGGFTLIELLVVIIIIVIMAGMTMAMLNVFMKDQGIRQGGNMVMNELMLCRGYAAEKRIMHFVVFENNAKQQTGVMRIFRDVNNTKVYDNGDLEIPGSEIVMPQGIIFKKVPAWIGVTPTGYCSGYSDLSSSMYEKRMRDFQEDGDIILTTAAGRYRAWCIDVDPAAGKVRRGVLLTDEKPEGKK